MERHGFKLWVISLEAAVDRKLSKWLKGPTIENGEATHYSWQFEQTHILLDIFWEDVKETIHLTYTNPRSTQRFEWHKLNNAIIHKVMDRVGNLAQVTMHPYPEYQD